MDSKRMKALLEWFGGPGLMILIGAVFLLFPDSAVALATKILAWFLVAAGVVMVIRNLTSVVRDTKGWMLTIVCLAVGGYMLANPLVISNLIGRILGVFLMIMGLHDLIHSRYDRAKFLGGLTFGVGLILVMIPRTLVNTLLALVGLVLMGIGAVNLFGRLRDGRTLEEPEDANIIDANA